MGGGCSTSRTSKLDTELLEVTPAAKPEPPRSSATVSEAATPSGEGDAEQAERLEKQFCLTRSEECASNDAPPATPATPATPSVFLADLDAGALFRCVDAFYKATSRRELTKSPDAPLPTKAAMAPDGSTYYSEASAASLVYGEVTTPVRVFTALRLHPDDTFADLGSGRGQIVLAAAMHADAAPRLSIGIEFHAARHAAAEQALDACDASVRQKVRILCADALASDLTHVSKVFICNATWGGVLTSRFAAVLHPSRAPRLERVATISEIPEDALHENELRRVAISAVGASWAAAGTALYVYERASASSAGDTAAAVVDVDRTLLDKVVADRRANAVRSRQACCSSEAEMERGLLRTSLLAASL